MPDDAFIRELLDRYHGDRDPLAVSGVPASPPVSPELLAALHGPYRAAIEQAGATLPGMMRADPVELAMGLLGPRARLMPAVRVEGKVYAAHPNHDEAQQLWLADRIKRGDKSTPDIGALYESGRLVDGYRTPDGRFLSRHEAQTYMGTPRTDYGMESSRLGAAGSPSSLVQRIDALPQAPRRDVLPSDLPIERSNWNAGGTSTQRPDMERWQILDARGSVGINAMADPRAKTLRITGSGLPPEQRDQGAGIAMYQRLIDQAHKRGYVVHSDNSLSGDAQKIYDALAQRGYRVERNPRAYMDRNPQGVPGNGPLLVNFPSEPVFTVHAPEYASPAVADLMKKYGLAGPAALGALNLLSSDPNQQ